MPRGRPRKCSRDKVLETAMTAFWRNGYEATSMNDLSLATGMAKPGLYAAFGDKEGLYRAALIRYFDGWLQPVLDELSGSQEPLPDSLRSFLNKIADVLSDAATPGGCFVTNTLTELSGQSEVLTGVAREFDDRRLLAVRDRIARAVSDGELPGGTDVDALAEFFAGQPLAMAVMGRAGADRAAMARLIGVAMRVLPGEAVRT